MSKRLFKTLVAFLAVATMTIGPAWGQNSTTYNVTFGGFLEPAMNTTVNVASLPQTFTEIGGYIFYPSNVLNGNCGEFISAGVTSGGEGKVSANIIADGSQMTITVSGTFPGTATIHVSSEYYDMEQEDDVYVSRDITVSCVTAPQPHTVRFASGNDGWTVTDVDSARSATAPAVLQNVMAGDSLVVTAPASLPGKVKSVKAVKYVPPIVNPVVGQFIGSDGKNYDANATLPTGVTAVAKIVYVGSDNGEAAPYNHGLALALSDASNGCYWKTSHTDAGHTKQTSSTFTEESGLQYNATHNSDDYPAFQAAIANNGTAAPTGCSDWFLASGYQWKKMIGAAGLSNLGLKGKACYWTSSEKAANYAWYFYTNGGGQWYDGYKDSDGPVRACLAF